MGQLQAELAGEGVRVAGIAVTATFSQMAFARQLGTDIPLLSDWEREVCAAYGVRYDSWKGHSGLAKRSIFVIDRDRVVRYAWSTDDALVEPDFSEVRAAILAVLAG